mgnify:FL=1
MCSICLFKMDTAFFLKWVVVLFEVKEVYSGINKFNIYHHELNDLELNNIISKMLFEKSALNYIFTANEDNIDSNYIDMARRFIPEVFFYREKEILDKWEQNKIVIEKMMKRNYSFYSFYAEALMAYLNYKVLNISLVSGVVSVDETLSDQKTGADACMFNDGIVILGEAKFYKDFNAGRNKIIEDFSSKSLINKINNLYRKSHKTLVHFKAINGESKSIFLEEFLKYNIVLSGFVLHNKKRQYSYEKIDNVDPSTVISNYSIVFYHLPINSKEDLIYLVIKQALELIVNESGK